MKEPFGQMAQTHYKENYFAVPTVAEMMIIHEGHFGVPKPTGIGEDPVAEILALQEGEVGMFSGSLVPAEFRSARKFMKHGEQVRLYRAASLAEAARKHQTPIDERKEKFDALSDVHRNAYRGYSFGPLWSERRGDNRIREVPLYECLEGARLYAYAAQFSDCDSLERITVRAFDSARRVARDGAEIVCEVPSRTEWIPPYEFKFMSVPVDDTPQKWSLAGRISTNHSCKSKSLNRIRYTQEHTAESSREFNFCAHEVAAYAAIIDYYWNERNNNLVPLQMSPFVLPSRLMAEFYMVLDHQVLIRPTRGSKPRRLNWAEKEILLWELVRTEGHDRTAMAKKGRDGDVRDYPWQQAA
ncbi:MAG TPA: hypothetical protein VJK52_02580 [Candidatus Nanoarchaeia archaeon]|nr:hypothetical protein [Candidatus Nanoarchaeia archaeon]